MERVYVLEQTLRSTTDKFQLKFAEKSVELLRAIRGVHSTPTNNGLLLLGITEAALDPAVAVLRARYGKELHATSKRVRYLDEPLREPIMDVFVRVSARHGDKVVRDLARRRAVTHFKIIEKRGWIMRVGAPMAELLGYADDLAAMTDDSAEHWITFNDWEPVDGGDPGRAA